MKHYDIMVSSEKPLNLDYARPFSNTNDLARNVPELSPSTAANKEKTEKERQEFLSQSEDFKDIHIEKQGRHKLSHSEKERYEEKQLSVIQYDRPLAVGFLQRKMVNNYYVYKR